MTDDVIRRGLAALDLFTGQGGLDADGWRAVRDAGAALERQLGGREPTVRERWLVDQGRRAAAWLGPPAETTKDISEAQK